MSLIISRLNTIWGKDKEGFSDPQTLSGIDQFDSLSQLFCPGPFYYMLFDLNERSFTFVDSKIEDFHGEHQGGYGLEYFVQRLHPDDVLFLQESEKMATQFFCSLEPTAKKLEYKKSYKLRFRDKDGTYRMMLHQATPLRLNADGRSSIFLVIHSDITHLNCEQDYKISFLSNSRNKSYINIPVGELLEHSASSIGLFSDREVEIIRLLAEGHTAKKIADTLHLSPDTVRTHRKNILAKGSCNNTTSLIVKCIKEGII